MYPIRCHISVLLSPSGLSAGTAASTSEYITCSFLVYCIHIACQRAKQMARLVPSAVAQRFAYMGGIGGTYLETPLIDSLWRASALVELCSEWHITSVSKIVSRISMHVFEAESLA